MWMKSDIIRVLFFSCRRRRHRHHRRHHQTDSGGLREKHCRSIARSGRSSELSDWCRPTTFAMTWPSDQNLERKTQFHYIKAEIVSPNNRCSTWCHSQLVILHIHFSIEWDKTAAPRARAHHISRTHIHLTFQRIERVRTRSLTLGHETGNCTYFVLQLNQV